MGLLTAEESREFSLRTVAQEGEEVVSANEVDMDPEDELRNSPKERRKWPRGRHDSQPRKRRKRRKRKRIDEVTVAALIEFISSNLRRAALIELRSSNSRAKSKMKARRLILEADSSIESRAVVSKERPTREAGSKVNIVREK